jgi:hypothetical protein
MKGKETVFKTAEKDDTCQYLYVGTWGKTNRHKGSTLGNTRVEVVFGVA